MKKFRTSEVQCDLCGYKWVAVMFIGTQFLECPKCDNMAFYKELKEERSKEWK